MSQPPPGGQPPVPPLPGQPQRPQGQQSPQPPPQVGQVVNGYMWDGGQWLPLSPDHPLYAAGGPQGTPGPGTASVSLPANSKKPLLKRWWVWVVGAVVLLLIISAIAGGGGGQVATPDAASAPATSNPSDQAEPDSGKEPSKEPEPDGNQEIGDQYGTFATISKSGEGDSTIRLPADAKAGMVTASHDGSANFAITALDASNEPTGDLLVNTIGSYKGVTAFGLSAVGEAVKIKISADGAWKIKIESLAKAPTLELPAKEEGDKVHIYTGGAEDWTITNTGQGNFAVIQHADLPNLMVNEIGRYKGTVPAEAGPNVVVINSDGEWKIAKA
jgi:hypothetical protein